MNNPFDYIPDAECDEAFRGLCARLERLKKSPREEDVNFCRELEEGKMLGLLIAEDADGVRHTLYAFSGQLGNGGFHYPGFVGPVFDYLEPEGYFISNEKKISALNREMASFEEGRLASIRDDYNCAAEAAESEVAEFKAYCQRSKKLRDEKRNAGTASADEMEAMIRQSQFEKAELHRKKIQMGAVLKPYIQRLRDAEEELESLRSKRKSDSEALQNWLFRNFRVLNSLGESKSLSDIFADTPMKTPPSGAGECCAPKLLHAAYIRGWHPVAMAEYWYGKPKGGEVRIHGWHYPACRGKCRPILAWMLQGLSVEPPMDSPTLTQTVPEPEIIYENEWFCVVNKPAGMLTVPGKCDEISVQQWLQTKYGAERNVRMAHRLDQDTSGVLVATFGDEPYRVVQSLFINRKVKKSYVALLEGDYTLAGVPERGKISLSLSPDLLDRPRQKVDHEHGKEGVTYYEFKRVEQSRSRIVFHPLTGRTHQLRVHAASASGLGMPIAGDRLYGDQTTHSHERMYLHSHRLEFCFPPDGKHYCFIAPVPF